MSFLKNEPRRLSNALRLNYTAATMHIMSRYANQALSFQIITPERFENTGEEWISE